MCSSDLALVRARQLRAPLRPALRDEFAGVLGIGSAIGATGMLIALAVGVMNLWAIPVFCAPLLLTQFSIRRFTAIRATDPYLLLHCFHAASVSAAVGDPSTMRMR